VVAEYAADEGISAKTLSGRPGALTAIAAVEAGQAAGLVVAKLDRLSRSVKDAATLLERALATGGHCTSPI